MFGSMPERHKLIVIADAQLQNSLSADLPLFFSAQSCLMTRSTSLSLGKLWYSVSAPCRAVSTLSRATRGEIVCASTVDVKEASEKAMPIAAFGQANRLIVLSRYIHHPTVELLLSIIMAGHSVRSLFGTPRRGLSAHPMNRDYILKIKMHFSATEIATWFRPEKDGVRLRHALEVRNPTFAAEQFHDLARKYGRPSSMR